MYTNIKSKKFRKFYDILEKFGFGTIQALSTTELKLQI